MKEVYLVYETDEWHTRKSYELRGVYDDKEAAICGILEDLFGFWDDDDEGTKNLAANLRKELEETDQTQGLATNYEIVRWAMNVWM